MERNNKSIVIQVNFFDVKVNAIKILLDFGYILRKMNVETERDFWRKKNMLPELEL